MKFSKIMLILCLCPLTLNAAPKPKLGESVAALDESIQSLVSTNATLNTNTLSLSQTMQIIGVDIKALDTNVKTLNMSTNTLNTTNNTLNSSTLNLNQTNTSLNNSVQSLEQKIESLQGSVNALKLSIDSLATNTGNNGGGSGNGGSNSPSIENLVYVTNCSIPTAMFVSNPSINYRCGTFGATMNLYKTNGLPNNDIIFEVPADKSFVMTGFSMLFFTVSIPNANPNLVLLERDSSNVSIRKKQLSYNNSTGIQTALSYSQAQGGIIFAPGSKVIISLDNNSSSSNSSIPFQFEMNGYLAN